MEGWALKREISLGTMIALAAQTAAFVWWAATTDNTLAAQGDRIAALEAQRAGERLAVVEATMTDVKQQLNRMETKIDRLAESRAQHP